MPRAASLGVRCVAPSASLLVAFSALSTSASPVAGFKPLSFLYPNYPSDVLPELQQTPPDYLPPCTPTSSKRTSGHLHHRRELPVRYAQGPDGRYRKDVSDVTLYGSTIVGNARAVPTSQADPQPVSSDFLETLPMGWKPEDRDTKTGLILALSLVLAFVICCLIIACIFWRNSVRKKARKRDPEVSSKRQGSRVSLNDEERRSQDVEKEVLKKKIKLWAKATARWKANARTTARQRRGHRLSPPRPQAAAETSSFALWSPLESPEVVSPVTTISISDGRSISGASEDTSDSLSLAPQSGADDSVLYSPPPPSITGRNSPPAYPSDFSSYQPIPSTSKPFNESNQTLDEESPGAYSPSTHFAHIAVDDKSRLEQLSGLASAPPQTQNSTPHQASGSAPAWPDDDFEEISIAEASQNASGSSSYPSMFPPPPSQSEIPAYDYSYSFADIEALPDPEPSAPPFEEIEVPENAGPSAPPLDEGSFYDDPPPDPCLRCEEAFPDAPPPDDPDPPIPLPS